VIEHLKKLCLNIEISHLYSSKLSCENFSDYAKWLCLASLVLATSVDMTQILPVSCYSRWPSQVRRTKSHCEIASRNRNQLCQWKRSLRETEWYNPTENLKIYKILSTINILFKRHLVFKTHQNTNLYEHGAHFFQTLFVCGKLRFSFTGFGRYRFCHVRLSLQLLFYQLKDWFHFLIILLNL